MPRTLRPAISLGFPGDPYTLFYDYDQIEDRKLSRISPEQKVIWFRERVLMTHIEPLRRIWEDEVVFERLLHSKLNPNARCSFSIAAMALMLGVVESLGSFRAPSLARAGQKDRNWRAFQEFLAHHLTNWDVSEARSGVSVSNVLWRSFRNGITHDLQIGKVDRRSQIWGSLEFHENFSNPVNDRFELHGSLLRVCPVAFFKDLDAGVRNYFDRLPDDSALMANFRCRFDQIYQN